MAINLSVNNTKDLYNETTFDDGILETGLYQGILKYAYTQEFPKSKAVKGLVVVEINGKNHTFEHWICDSKTGTPEDSDGNICSGFIKFNSAVFCATGKNADQLGQEEKTIKIWDFSSNSEQPTQANCIAGIQNNPIIVGVKKVHEHITQKQPDGTYLPTDKMHYINEAAYYFNADSGKTAKETVMDAPAAQVIKFKSNAGKVYERKPKKTVVPFRGKTDLNKEPAATSGVKISQLFG